jgi:hypothetical protein
LFATTQEAARKDIERCFGVIVQRFGILKQPLRHWYQDEISNTLYCCVILHNMAVEARRDGFSHYGNNLPDLPDEGDAVAAGDGVVSLFTYEGVDAENMEGEGNIAAMRALRVAGLSINMRDEEKHNDLQRDLMAHIWDRRSR